MPLFVERRVREAMGQPENIRCVAIVGQKIHGKTMLANKLRAKIGLNATAPEVLVEDQAASAIDGTNRLQVSMLLTEKDGSWTSGAKHDMPAPGEVALPRGSRAEAGSRAESLSVNRLEPESRRQLRSPSKERRDQLRRVSASSQESTISASNEPHSAAYPPPLLVYLLDAPGHTEFAADAVVALRLADIALLVVDASEGCLGHTEALLQQALAERVRPFLFINGLDRCILDLKMQPAELDQRLRSIVDHVNRFIQARPDELLPDATVCPKKGTVIFGSALDGWAFSLESLANRYATKLAKRSRDVVTFLWDQEARSEKFTEQALGWLGVHQGKASSAFRNAGIWDVQQSGISYQPSCFCDLVLAPLSKLMNALIEDQPPAKLLEVFGTCVADDDQGLTGRTLVRNVLSRGMDLTDMVMEQLRSEFPSPSDAQKYRVENLYRGPTDDQAAVAVRMCDATGPMMTFIARMLPAPPEMSPRRMYALGRVFSGTLRVGEPIRVYCPSRHGELEGARSVRAVEGAVLPLGDSTQNFKGADIPCGNIVLMTGLENFVIKEGTLSNQKAAAPLRDLGLGALARHVLRVAVQPLDPETLPKLTDALRLLSQLDPLVQCAAEEWGQHIVAGSGECHLDSCLHLLRAEFAPLELRVSAPPSNEIDDTEQLENKPLYGVAYCETVRQRSDIVARVEPSLNLCSFAATAEALDSDLCANIEEGMLAQCAGHEERARFLEERYRCPPSEKLRVWCFGLSEYGTNAVISDSTVGIDCTNSVHNREPPAELRGSVGAACTWVSREGALCEETLRGTMFQLKEARLGDRAVQRGAGQIVGAARRAFLAAQLSAYPGLQEPILRAEFLCPTSDSHRNSLEELLTSKGVKIVSQEAHGWANRLRILAELPAVRALGLPIAIQKAVHYDCSVQFSFGHWMHVDGFPSEPGSHQELVLRLRGWRQLDKRIPIPEDLLRPEAATAPEAIFNDDLLDIAVKT